MKRFFYLLATDQLEGAVYIPLKFFLALLSYVYLFFFSLAHFLYQCRILKTHHLQKPVISIGNITWGGSGKTPLVEFVCQLLMSEEIHPAILMRGYMDKSNTGFDAVSDEAQMLRQSLRGIPVLAGANRVKSAQSVPSGFLLDVFILDDGFQHWRIFRDLDIVVIDCTNPWGNGALIPRGILRESFQSVTRADLIVLTKVDLGKDNLVKVKQRLNEVGFCKTIVETIHEPFKLVNMITKESIPLFFLQGKNIVSFCSIGNPSSFEATLKKLGAKVIHQAIFMDHYVYTSNDVEKLNQICEEQEVKVLVTTFKDAVKLENLKKHFDKDLIVLVLHIRISMTKGKEEFVGRINSIVRR